MKTWEGLEEIVLRIENSNARAVTFRARRFNRSTRPTHFCHKIRLPADQQLRGGGIILPIGLRLVADSKSTDRSGLSNNIFCSVFLDQYDAAPKSTHGI